MLTAAIVTVASGVATADNPDAAETLPMQAPTESGEYQTLFDGATLDGWKGDDRLWTVRDGIIHGETTKEKSTQGNTFLIWQGGEVGDFELRLSFRMNASNNSGIQYRSRMKENGRNPFAVYGYQHELRNEVDFPNVPGFIYDESGSRRRLILVGEQAVQTADGKKVLRDDLIDQAEFKKLMKLDDWNDVVIVAKGNNVRHYLNGRLLIDFTDEHPTKAFDKGLIALQLHAGKPMFAEFKNIKLKSMD